MSGSNPRALAASTARCASSCERGLPRLALEREAANRPGFPSVALAMFPTRSLEFF